jgi:hypothetical protein
MSVNEFRPKKFEDFEIVDDKGGVVGHVRVKPSGILWAPKGSHVWHGLTIKEFGDLAIEHGKKQGK